MNLIDKIKMLPQDQLLALGAMVIGIVLILVAVVLMI